MNEIIQYFIVGIILLASIVWIVVKFRRKKQGKDSGCCGCSLQESCCSKKKKADCCERKP